MNSAAFVSALNSHKFHELSFFCLEVFSLSLRRVNRLKFGQGGQFMRWGGVAENDCRWSHCPLLSPPVHCSLYPETIKSCKRVSVDLFQSAAAAPSPVMGNMPPNDAMPGGPMPPGFFQVHAAPSAATLLTPPSLHYHQHTLTSTL